MRTLLTCAVLSVLALPLAARAEGSVELGASVGIAKPFGDIGDGLKLGDSIDWAFPLAARLAFRVAKPLAVGAYGRYAPTAAASTCPGCTVHDVGLGALVEYRFGEKPEGGPWVGLSAGWEQLKTSASGGGSGSATGFEVAAAGGSDFEVGGLTVGPFVQLSLGEFTKTSAGSIDSKGMHGWFGVGVRVTLLL
jgi:hypothetical protein